MVPNALLVSTDGPEIQKKGDSVSTQFEPMPGDGRQMPLNQAAKYYKVNKKSLMRRTSGEVPINASVGFQTALAAIHERELASCIKLMAKWGWGFTPEEIKDVVKEFVKAKNIKTPFKDGRPGYDWLKNFKRHPEIAPRKTEQLSTTRARAEDPEVLNHWYQLLDHVLTESGIKDMPAQIFNTDETGFVTDPKSDIVLAARGAKRVNQSIGGSGREQVTVNCAASANGKLLPLYVVYQGKNLYEAWTKDGPTNTAYNTSAKGWMEAPLFLDWFRKIFLQHTRDVSDKTRLLVFYGHASHLSLELVQEAKRHNIVLLRLPAHMTHYLQPLDRAVFFVQFQINA